MKKRMILITAVFVISTVLLSAQEPDWWENAHRDDEFNMYERGSAVNAPTEQDAMMQALLAAKNMLVQRIGITPALKESGINTSAEYAIVNFETSGITTYKTGKTWSAWLLLKYPQKEKKILLDRWNASLANIASQRKQEKTIPSQFGLALQTEGMKTQFRDGETVVFTVTAEKDCYLLLVDHMSDGTTVLLFPNRFNPDGFIKKGRQIIIPSPENARFNLVVVPPFGEDRIEAIASTEKNSLYEKFSAVVKGLDSSQEVAVISRGIFVQGISETVTAETTAKIQWSQAELVISSYGK